MKREQESPVKTAKRSISTAALLSLFALFTVLGASIMLVVHRLPVHSQSPVKETAKWQVETDQIIKACAMGINSSVQSETKASLQRYFTGIEGEAKVTSSDIGSIADKVTPGDSGNELYKAYSDCLKIQMALALSRHGINVQSNPSASEIEEGKHLDKLVSIAAIGPDTPSAKLIEILGQPDRENYVAEDRDGKPYQLVAYSYKEEVKAFEIFRKGERVAVALAWYTSNLDDAEQLKANVVGDPLMSLGRVLQSCTGKLKKSMHGVLRSGLCGGSHANDYQYKIYLFAPSSYIDDVDECKGFMEDEADTIDQAKCPKLANSPPFAVAMGRSDVDLERAGEAFFNLVVYD